MTIYTKEELENKYKEDLMVIARKLDIPGFRRLKKDTLVLEIMSHQKASLDNSSTSSATEWYQSPTVKKLGVLATILTIFSVSYGFLANSSGHTLFSDKKNSTLLPLSLEQALDEVNQFDHDKFTSVQKKNEFEKIINVDEYIGKYVEWIGQVGSINSINVDGYKYYMNLISADWNNANPEVRTTYMFVYFKQGQVENLERLSLGDTVRVRAYIDGFSYDYPGFNLFNGEILEFE